MGAAKAKERKLRFKSIDGTRLVGLITLPANVRLFAAMMHGITEDKNEWHDFYVDMARHLSSHDIATLRFDFRGHGESGGSSTDLSIVGCVLDIKAAIEQIRGFWKGSVIFIATSFGAGPAILVADQKVKIVSHLVLISPVIDYAATFLKPQTDWARSSFTEEALREVSKRGYLLLDKSYKLGARLIEEFRLIHPARVLDGIEIPVLTIHGDRDTMVPYAVSRAHGAPNQWSKFVTLLDADHGYVDSNDDTGRSPKSRENKARLFNEIVDFIKRNQQ